MSNVSRVNNLLNGAMVICTKGKQKGAVWGEHDSEEVTASHSVMNDLQFDSTPCSLR